MGESEIQTAPWYQSTLFWGCMGAVLAIVLTVLAAMMKDIRWLLFFAWPFATFAAWEFARAISSRRLVVYESTIVSAIVTGAMLGWLYFGLAPKDGANVTAEPSKQDAPKGKERTQLVSTVGKTVFRCTKPKNLDGQDPAKARAEAKQNMRAMGENFGLSVDLKDIPNGISIEITPNTDEGKLRMSAAEKYTIEVRSSGPELLVYARMQLISVMGMIADLMPVDPKSESILSEAQTIEQIVGVAPGACRLM